MHLPCEPTTIVLLIRLIVIERQSALHRVQQASPICPMARDQLEIYPAIGRILCVQRRGAQPAVRISLALFLQHAGHREISAENGQPPLTDLHATSQVRNRPGVRPDGSEEVQFKGGDQDPRQPVCRNRITQVIKRGDPPAHRTAPIVRTHQPIKSFRALGFVTSTLRSKRTATYASFISVCSENPDFNNSARYFETAGWMKYLACFAISSVPRSSGVPSDRRVITSSIATPYWQYNHPSGVSSSSHPSEPRSIVNAPPASNSSSWGNVGASEALRAAQAGEAPSLIRESFDEAAPHPAPEGRHAGPPNVGYSLQVLAADICDPYAPPVQGDPPPHAACRSLHNIGPAHNERRLASIHRAIARQWTGWFGNRRWRRRSAAEAKMFDRSCARHRLRRPHSPIAASGPATVHSIQSPVRMLSSRVRPSQNPKTAPPCRHRRESCT